VAKLDRSAIDDLAARVLESGVAPAAALAVTDPERTLLARTYGAASPEALWPVASIGKSFTGVVALQLVEEGLLDLHAPVSDYVPWLSVRTQGGPVTLHHLLTHTAGLSRAPTSRRPRPTTWWPSPAPRRATRPESTAITRTSAIARSA
jgi:CubicO group peptidase (beta-lactamase class C family)